MKLLFIEARKKLDLDVNGIDFSLLPKEVFIAYSIQFKEFAEKIKAKLGKRVKGFSQVLGCSPVKSEYPILLVGSGRFHALNLALTNQLYILEGLQIAKLNEKEVEKIKAKRKAALSRFYSAEKIGILVSTKSGQENLKEAVKLRKGLAKKGKKTFIFLADNINLEELENYPVDSWVNTSCPALTFDARIVNSREIGNKYI
ncbi:hypothetical protein A3K73_03310 [Candidatus Pacearchaeota archaeon RBG_13_36_9]|nr:MAG: hypothetical protein A3K73_03310 [Candidatus Pacearchaeota archaeon RBG_13_36_9]